eukprot:13459635-Ditylum_brightwellii.AAC.1
MVLATPSRADRHLYSKLPGVHCSSHLHGQNPLTCPSRQLLCGNNRQLECGRLALQVELPRGHPPRAPRESTIFGTHRTEAQGGGV